MKAKLNGITVEIKNVVEYAAPDPRYNTHRTVAITPSGVVLMEHTSKGAAPSRAPWIDQLTDLSD